MPKKYVTFGQNHIHKFNNKTFDNNCVAVIECESSIDGRNKAFKLFGDKFCFTYFENLFDFDSLKYFPRGLIEVD